MSNSMTEHFTHPGHKLVRLESNKEYLCGCCKTLGSAKTFRCSSCDDFNMHEFCGECPKQLSTFMHPLHRLSLVVRKARGTRTNDRTCDVCGDDLEGFFYRCKDCDFDLHPICTQLPQNLRHALHVEHPLVLQKSKLDGPCCVCKGVCKSWRYRCGECDGFDIHLECVLLVASPSCATTRHVQVPPPYTSQTPPYTPQPPLYGGYPYGWVPPNNSGPYYNMYNSGLVNNQAYMYNPVYPHHHGYAQPYNMYNPVYPHHHGYAQPYNMYNPAFSTYNSCGGVPYGPNLCNSIYCNPYGCGNCKPQEYNNMYNPYVGPPLSSAPYNMYGAYDSYQNPEISTQNYEIQDGHGGAPNETQNCANHDHHQGVGSTDGKVSLGKRMFKLVGAITVGVVSNVIFGFTFPGLS